MRRTRFDTYSELYKKGVAVGYCNIRSDTLIFRFRDETFEFPTGDVLPGIAFWNGYFYTAPVKKLRKLEADAVSG